MTNLPPNMPPSFPPQPEAPLRTGMALTSMILGIIGLVTGCFLIGIPIGIVALVLGIIALVRANNKPRIYGGKGYAIAGIATGALVGVAMLPMIAILLPSLAKAKELANRSSCAANLRGISNSMIIYAAVNSDSYPILPPAPYSSSNAGTSAATGGTTADETVLSMYRTGSPTNGSVLASEWVLVLQGSSPKLYLCRSDKFVKGPASLLSGSNYYTNFQSDDQISYSFAYPYTYGNTPSSKSTMAVAPWWRNSSDASVAIAADMAPLNGTGNPRRDVATPSAKAWNSGNHGGDGQNVAYADVHVDFVKRPTVGQGSPDADNIYTTGGSSGATSGGTQPTGKSPIRLNADLPYDILMVPTRNLDTGGL